MDLSQPDDGLGINQAMEEKKATDRSDVTGDQQSNDLVKDVQQVSSDVEPDVKKDVNQTAMTDSNSLSQDENTKEIEINGSLCSKKSSECVSQEAPNVKTNENDKICNGVGVEELIEKVNKDEDKDTDVLCDKDKPTLSVAKDCDKDSNDLKNGFLESEKDKPSLINSDDLTCDKNIDLETSNEKPSPSSKEEVTKPSNEKPHQIFEDISDDDNSDDEEVENIELELDDLIDPIDLNKSCSSSSCSEKGEKEDIEVDCEKSNVNGIETTSHLDADNDKLSQTKSSTDPMTPVVPSEKNNLLDKTSPITQKSSDIENSSAIKNIVNISRIKKSTARKSGKPISQIADLAPLKTINTFPIKAVSSDLSQIEALNLDTCGNSHCQPSPNSFSDSSIRKITGIKKKRGRKNTYNFPGFRKNKAKKLRMSFDLGSSGSSAESVSYSDGDIHDSDCSHHHFSPSSPSSLAVKKRKLESQSTPPGFLSKHSLSLTPSPLNTTETSKSLNSCKTSSSEGNSPLSRSPMKSQKKMKTVLDMLHERNRMKVEMEENKTTKNKMFVQNTEPTTTTYVSIEHLFSFTITIYYY